MPNFVFWVKKNQFLTILFMSALLRHPVLCIYSQLKQSKEILRFYRMISGVRTHSWTEIITLENTFIDIQYSLKLESQTENRFHDSMNEWMCVLGMWQMRNTTTIQISTAARFASLRPDLPALMWVNLDEKI